jgi:hypothetical protein
VQAGPLDRQRLDPGAAVDQRLEQRLGPPSRQLEHPFAALARAPAGKAERHGPSLGAGAQADDRPKPVARLVDPALERDLAPAMIAIRSHSRSAWAMTWVEKMIVAPARRLVADQLLEPRPG